jgi:hypothetical protein
MPEYLRVLVSDIPNEEDDHCQYSDKRLQRVILVAARQVLSILTFHHRYHVDIGGMCITPDPTADPHVDVAFVNLVCLKAACLIDRAEAAAASKQGIAVRDGASSVDLRGNLQGRLKLLDSPSGNCEGYAQAKLEYQAGLVDRAGQAIMGPVRTFITRGIWPGNRFR